MKVVIDKERCLMSGECYYNHPEVFRMDDEGYPVVLIDQLEQQALQRVNEAIEVCPAVAISLTD